MLGPCLAHEATAYKEKKMAFYLFYQETQAGAEKWKGALASERETITSKAAFVTVLDVDNAFAEDMPQSERLTLKYQAPLGFYADFDAEDIDEILGQSRLWLTKLVKEQDLDPEQVRYYFTGGRGVHIEIPMICMLAKIPRDGISNLPAIFKEIAMATYVDGYDLRTYSGGRGRMWRAPNIQRSNGLYKVQVTHEEFMNATAEDYAKICSTPRRGWDLKPATNNPKLSYLYSTCRDKVDKAVKARGKRKDQSPSLTKFKGNWPDSIRLVLSGEGVNPDMGWNQIALQVACLALALNKSEDDTINEARGLIDNHQGDSNRYGTQGKRERELRNQYRYLDGNPAYEFRISGAVALFADRNMAQDLRSGDSHDDMEDFGCEITAPSGDKDLPADEAAKHRLARNLKWTKEGIFVLEDDEWHLKCHFGIANPTALYNAETGKFIGYQAEVHVEGKNCGQQILGNQLFTTKAQFNSYAAQHRCSVQLSDAQCSLLTDYLRIRTMATKSQIFTTSREGVDFVVPPRDAEGETPQMVLVTHENVLVNSRSELKLKFSGVRNIDATFKTDILDAPDLESDAGRIEEMQNFLDHMFEVSSPEQIGKVLGWSAACLMSQAIRHRYKQFPLLQVYGTAGSGKSKTVELFSHLHYWQVQPKKLAAAGQTFFPILIAVAQSASIPVIFEEYKPRSMTKYNKDQIHNFLRLNYTGDTVERGNVDKSQGGGLKVEKYDIKGPLVFISEAMETEPAIVERCVTVPMSKEARAGRTEHYDYCFERRTLMGILGKHLARRIVMRNDWESVSAIDVYGKHLADMIGSSADDNARPIFNLSCIVYGLNLVKQELSELFGTRYSEKIEALKTAVIGNTEALQATVQSEISKTLDVLARLSRHENPDYRLDPRSDYQVDGDAVALKAKQVYAKYTRYQRSVQQEILFDTDAAFMKALENYPGLLGKNPAAGVIRRNQWEKIYALSQARMLEDGVEPFEGYGE